MHVYIEHFNATEWHLQWHVPFISVSKPIIFVVIRIKSYGSCEHEKEWMNDCISLHRLIRM